MPVRPPLANTCKVILKFIIPSTTVQATCILYVLLNRAPTIGDLGALVTGFGNSLITGTNNLMANLSTTWQYAETTVVDNSGVTENFVQGFPAHSGSVAGLCCPPQVAVCLSWGITARYRGGKPRSYIPGIPTTALVATGSNNISVASQTSFANSGTKLISDITAVTAGTTPPQLGTISYFTGKAPRPTPLFRPYQLCTVHQRLDSQRRRLGKELDVL